MWKCDEHTFAVAHRKHEDMLWLPSELVVYYGRAKYCPLITSHITYLPSTDDNWPREMNKEAASMSNLPVEVLEDILQEIVAQNIHELCVPPPGTRNRQLWNSLKVLPQVSRRFRVVSMRVFATAFYGDSSYSKRWATLKASISSWCSSSPKRTLKATISARGSPNDERFCQSLTYYVYAAVPRNQQHHTYLARANLFCRHPQDILGCSCDASDGSRHNKNRLAKQ